MTSSANSLAQAANRLRGELQRHTLWDQTVAVVISESLAREGIGDVSDVIIRFPGMNRRAYLYIFDGVAEDVLHFDPVMQPLAATHLRGLADQFLLHPTFAHPQEFVSIHAELQEQGVVLIPRLTMKDGWLSVSGAGVLDSGRLVGWLNEGQTEGANWVLGHVLRSLVDAACPMNADGHIGAWVRLHGHSIRTRIEDGLPQFDIRLSITARLVDAARCPIVPENPSDRHNIGAELTATVKTLVESAAHRAQRELRADFLGLREQLRRSFPAVAEGVDWEELFPHVRITTEVSMARGGVVYPGESLRTVPYR